MTKSNDESEQVKEWIRKILSLLDEDSELRTLAGQLVHKVTSIDVPERSALRKEIQLKKSEGKEADGAMIGPAPPGRRRAKAAPEEVSAAFDPFEIYKTFGREELKEQLTQLTQKDVKIIIQKYVPDPSVNYNYWKKMDRLVSFVLDRVAPPLPDAGPPEVTEKKSSRRSTAELDPFKAFTQMGEDFLKAQLEEMDVKQLQDIIKAYGLDSTKRSHKWKTKEKLVSLIENRTKEILSRGDVFNR